MSVRDTSIEAYHAVMESGYIGKMQKRVYAALYEHGPCTAGELFYKMSLGRNPSHSNVGTRLGELRDQYGVAVEMPAKKFCERSGHLAIEWDVTSRHPTRPKKREPAWKAKVEAAVVIERERCARVAESWNADMIAHAIRKG